MSDPFGNGADPIAQALLAAHAWSSLPKNEQQSLIAGAYSPKDGAEADKYDETLGEKGSIIMPSNPFGAQDWQWGKGWDGVNRYDLPDGRVILQKSSPAAPIS